MFDIGFWEILLILVLALVVIGPERLPGAARQAGLFVGKARRYIEGVRSEVESELDVGEFKRMLHNQEIQINELQQKLKAGVDEVQEIVPYASTSDILSDTRSHTVHDEVADSTDSSEGASENSALDQPSGNDDSAVANKDK
ncbi:MAG: Sec-independent protein translocase protein TatB [Gammaproteobacteria bacterium]|nr:Sec-independent protein translocase protein TatB [Gammaproteobacteria bacterium]